MKIAVMATGGVGGYFGARLAAAGEDIRFIARGAHLEALRTNGLELRSANGDLHLKPVNVIDDPRTIGPVDIVMFAVKHWDLEIAGAACKPLIGAETAVISFLNGVDSEERLIPILGRERVMGGVAYCATAIAAPGVIEHTGTFARLLFGELDGTISARSERFYDACKKARIDATLSSDIVKEFWVKFAMLASFSGMTSLTRTSIGPIRDEPVTRQLLLNAIGEAMAVAKAKGINLGPDYLEKQVAFLTGAPAEFKSSMLLDLERGNRLELDWLSGAVAHLGDAVKVPTPTHHFIHAALKPHAMGRK